MNEPPRRAPRNPEHAEHTVDTMALSAPPPARPRLIVLTGPHVGRKFPVVDGAVIGRSSMAQICIDHPGLSREHARLGLDRSGRVRVNDLGGLNGTLVNGEAVELHDLKAGDRLQLGGGVVLAFVLEDPAEEQSLHTHKMEVFGRMSAGIAHDFNNMLTVMMATSDCIRALPPGTDLEHPEVKACLDDLDVATRRAAELTARLSPLMRSDEGLEDVDVSAMCNEILDVVSRTFPQKVVIERAIEPGLMVYGSRTRLNQLLLNPCVNARDAMPDGGTLRVCVERVVSQGSGGGSALDEVAVSFHDTGVGMDSATLQHAFEPFFTTKERGVGTGLGLATVQKIARDHGGIARASSVVGSGTTISVHLPAVSAALRKRRSSATVDIDTYRQGALGDRAGSILVVEDDESVARCIGRALERGGHSVRYAVDGQDALDVFEKPERPDLIVLDVDMPRMGGEECFHELRRLDPGVRVVFVSGRATDEQRELLLHSGARGCLKKPLDIPALQGAVAAALC